MTVGPIGRRQRGLLLAGCTLVLALVLPSSASAHAVLVTSVPSWNQVVHANPRQVTLTYDEDVVPHYARVTVVVGTATRDVAGPPRVSGNVVVVELEAAAAGSYTVRWRMVAANDGHVTQGAFSFGVRARPLPPAPAKGVSVPVAPQLLAWLQFLGVVLAGGTLTFRALVLTPVARGLGDRGDREASIAIWVAVVGAALALHAGLFGFLVGAYPIVGGGILNVINTEIIPIRVGTHLGQAWTLTTFAWLGVLTLLVGAWVTPRKREPLLASAGILSLAIGFGISYASHPDARGTLALWADYLHLLAAALWVGGVVALTILVGVARPLSRPEREPLVRECLLRFSRLAVPSVAVLAAAGAYLALRELPTVSSVLNSSYGITLLLKSIVFVAAFALAAYHRGSVMPRIAAGAPVATIRRTLTLEVTLLLVALALAAVLSQTAPPT
ncbi:MAG TPA: copper resistance protein CopC [Solirubrobacteraceae bacterium]|nr:copper resistance protein CopC [Solirubrobacteraceae bacterium]